MTTVYVTGASAGLGRAIARAFAKDGADVGLIARDENALRKASAEMPGKASWAVTDVSDYKSLSNAAEHLQSQIGAPDIWINNAMVTIFSRFEDITPEEFAKVTEVTYLGSVYGIREAFRLMKKEGGHIIQIGSALSYRSIPLQAPYCGAKSAIRGAIDALRCEMIHDGVESINITHIHMPAINTPQFDWARRHLAYHPMPLPPIYSPKACAQAVLWASNNPDKREVWVGWPAIQAILGDKFFPALMDLYMARKAYSGQFDKTAEKINDDGNLFHPAEGLHRTRGRFAGREHKKVFWISTSRQQETILMIAILVLILFLILL